MNLSVSDTRIQWRDRDGISPSSLNTTPKTARVGCVVASGIFSFQYRIITIKKASPSSTDRLWSFGFNSPAVPTREDALLLCYRQVSWLSAFSLRSGPSHPIRDSGNLIFSCQSPYTVARPRRLFTAFPNLNNNNYIGSSGSVKIKIKKSESVKLL